MGNFQIIDHPADVAVEISGNSLEDVFQTAWEAWYETVLGPVKVSSKVKKNIRLQAATSEELLVNFINEINYWLLVKKWITVKIDILELFTRNEKFNLKAMVSGQTLDSEKHELQIEVKAVTFHQMEIKQTGHIFFTRMVFDV